MMNLFYKLKTDERLRNSLWMLIEKSISLFGLIFIISAVAKYTGPKIYGEISLAASIFIVLKTIAQLGLDQIYFKYVSQKKPYHNLFFNNSVLFISISYFILSLVIVFVAFFYASSTGFWFIISTAVAYYFSSIDLANSYFEGQLLSKYNVFANIFGLLIALALRYIVVFYSLDVLYLCVPIIFMAFIPFLVKIYIFKKKYCLKDKLNLKNKKITKYFYYFFVTGFPLTLAVLSATINGQVANFILASISGVESVGIYSVAFILAGAWCVVPTTIIMSYMTSIYNINYVEKEKYIILASKILRSIFILSFIVVVILYISAPYIVSFLYGSQYYQSVEIMRFLLLMQMIWVMGFFFSRLIIKYNGFKFLAYKSILSCMLNLCLTYFFVRKFGVLGAAYAIVVTEIFSSIIFNLMYQRAQVLNVILQSIGVTKK